MFYSPFCASPVVKRNTLLSLQTAEISDEKAAEFRHKVYRAITLTHVAEYLLIALGGLCIVVAVVLVFVFAPKKKQREMCIQARMNLLFFRFVYYK